MAYILKYDSEFHFMATFETAFKLPLFCHFTLVTSLWQEILFTPILHFNTLKNYLWNLAFPKFEFICFIDCGWWWRRGVLRFWGAVGWGEVHLWISCRDVCLDIGKLSCCLNPRSSESGLWLGGQGWLWPAVCPWKIQSLWAFPPSPLKWT